ncbi:MAG: HAMP domain-containing protein [Desulfobulbales bacterium]|nr:HAMP domain-containing protein [Desulfobulbales bacterium]
MNFSFRTAKNLGIFILLSIIVIESLFVYVTMTKNAERLTAIITVDQIKLRRWYNVAEIISHAKDNLYDYRLGRSEVIAPVDLMINEAVKEINEIKVLATDQDEVANIRDIITAAKRFRQAIYAFETEVREGYRGGSSARQMENLAVREAARIAELGSEAAAYVSKRIEEKNIAILKISKFSQKMLTLVLFIAILATIVNAYFMARALEKPIKKLVEGTNRVAEGDLTHRVKVHSNDEIGKLAASFNAMAVKLKKSRQELLTAKAYTDNIIRSMTNSLVVINKDQTIRAANQATYDLLGYTKEEFIGKPFSMIFAKGYYNSIGIEELINKGFTRNVETLYLSKYGEKIRMLFTASVIFNDEGSFEGIVCVAQDISMHTETLRAGHLASIGELAAGVAHEINNPINTIINFAQLIIDGAKRGDIISEDIPERIIKEGDRVANIVKSLLSFAREDEKEKRPVAVREIIDEVLALTEAQIVKDGITLTLDVPQQLHKVLADFQQIEQVFLNIVNNARYALNERYPKAHPQKNFVINADEETIDNTFFITVTFIDYGTGIDPSIIEKIYNPFFSTKPSGIGTGLGLAISHGIITDHDGKLTIESNYGEYTKIIVQLPAIAELH